MTTAVRRMTTGAVAGLLLLAAGPAVAKDLCFYLESGGLFLVAQPWKLPGAGKCKPFVGHAQANGPTHGTVCRTSDGSILRFGLTANRQGGFFDPPVTRQIAMA